ncbi:AAA family ATPase [Amycolatopsis sp.]|uniref:AAA family ATPase n=1 Tax=Amycolatopsis sp. TaxID=37632 RepID=UPI002DFA1782|nr:AAA family ATPase [Amycolatopsis sp.]
MSERQLSDRCPPGWHEDRPGDELVGRDGEVALLADRIAGLRAGRSAVATVTGRPGTGRSALLRKALLLAKNAGVRTVALRCSRADADVPYGLVSRLAATLDFPRPAGPAQCGEFLAVTRDRPTVVAVDDLQWADPLSQRWLRTVARRLHTTSLFLVCAVRGRQSEVDINGPWVSGSVLELGPLGTDEVREIIAAGYSGAVEDEFAACATTATGGIPAVLKAALGRFALTGLPPAAAQLPAFSLRANETVNHYLDDIMLDVPPGALDLLRAMAVADGSLDFELVRTLAGSPGTPTPELLGPLVSAGLVEPSGSRPAAPEVTGKVLAGMAAKTRHALYSRAAELGHLAAISDPPLGTLLLGAPAVGKSWAVDTLHRAATRHRVEGRASQAMALLRRALLEPVDEPRRRRLLMDLAAAEVRESPDGSDRRLRQILLSPETRGDGPVLVKAADLLVARGSTSDTRRVLTTVCTREGVDPAALETLTALGWLAHGGETDEREFPVASAPILPPLPDLPTDPTQAAIVAWQLACRGRGRSRAKTLARAALNRGVDQNRPLTPRIVAGMALGYTGETAEAMAGLDGVLADARRQNARAAAGQALLHRAILAQRDGQLAEAAEDLASARAQLPLNCWSPSALPAFLALDVLVNLERGSLDRAQRAAAVELPPDAENGIGWARLLCARGVVELTTGSPEAALHRFQEAGRVLVSRQWMNPALVPWRVLAATANRRCGNENAARRLVREEVELAREWGSPTALGVAHLGAGNALGGAEGTGYLEEAVWLLRNSPARLRYATAVIDLAAVRLDAGELDEATALLRGAEDVAQLHLADGLVRRLRELSERLAAKRSAPDLRTPFSRHSVLSGQEEHLAGLAAAGRSNTEIAASLSVSTRTVELRLAKIYRKLGVTGRTGLRSVYLRQPMEN